MRKHFHSCFPATNVCRLPEWYSTDTFISNVPAMDDGVPGHGGCCLLQVYGGMDSELVAGYPMTSEHDLPSTLQDFIRDYGAMEGLKSDNAKSETSFTMKGLFRMYLIKDRQSEPHYQHQNPIERQIQDLKQMMHGIMDCVVSPPSSWLLCIFYVIGLLNVLTNSKGFIPLTVVTGCQTDVSPYLDFHFWQEVLGQDQSHATAQSHGESHTSPPHNQRISLKPMHNTMGRRTEQTSTTTNVHAVMIPMSQPLGGWHVTSMTEQPRLPMTAHEHSNQTIG